MKQHPREAFNGLFDPVDECFAATAAREHLTFDRTSGGSVGRSLILHDDPLSRGIYLQLKHHWTRSDPADPVVVLTCFALYCPGPASFPRHALKKKVFDGKLSELTGTIDENLKLAISTMLSISKDQIIAEGDIFESARRDAVPPSWQ